MKIIFKIQKLVISNHIVIVNEVVEVVGMMKPYNRIIIPQDEDLEIARRKRGLEIHSLFQISHFHIIHIYGEMGKYIYILTDTIERVLHTVTHGCERV